MRDNSNHNNTSRGGAANTGYRQNQEIMNTTPRDLPENYIDEAEKIMGDLSRRGVKLTTSKIRNILSRVSDIYNVEVERTAETLLPESVSSLQMTRVRIAYECGRENTVKDFVEESQLLRYIKGVENSRTKFLHFARYMEALVAYHRFYGGKDN